MKNKNRKMYKTILLLACIVLSGMTVGAQGIKPTNVYRVTVTSRYVIEDGERTRQFYAVNQEVSDSLGRMHTEIDYDWETRYPGNYRWHFFDSMLLVRTEYFVDETLDRRVVFEHDHDTVVVAERHYKLQGADNVLFKTLEYTCNTAGLPVRVVARNDAGRRLYRSRSVFDDHGTEIRRRVTGRRGDPEDGIRRLDREAEYDTAGLMVSETVQLRMSDRSREQYTRKFTYDEQGNVTGVLELDEEGNQLSRTEYAWDPRRGRLQRIISYDDGDNLVKYLAKRYEIYRTSDRRHRVIDY